MFAFVLMPLDHKFSDVYQLGIKEAAKSAGFNAERVDEQIFQENMLVRIYSQIELADVVIADMTGRNANVFYEVGYAHAKNKPCILLTQSAIDIPFDLKQYRHIVYSATSINELRSDLLRNLNSLKDTLSKADKRIQADLFITSSHLIKTAISAEAHLGITIDFHNRTNDSSDEIETVYFYTDKDWIFSAERTPCPSIKSDVAGYDLRHLLKWTRARLERQGGWLQLQLDGTKLIAQKKKGAHLEDEYWLGGNAMIRLITKGKTLDYTFTLASLVKNGDFI